MLTAVCTDPAFPRTLSASEPFRAGEAASAARGNASVLAHVRRLGRVSLVPSWIRGRRSRQQHSPMTSNTKVSAESGADHHHRPAARKLQARVESPFSPSSARAAAPAFSFATKATQSGTCRAPAGSPCIGPPSTSRPRAPELSSSRPTQAARSGLTTLSGQRPAMLKP